MDILYLRKLSESRQYEVQLSLYLLLINNFNITININNFLVGMFLYFVIHKAKEEDM